jgi:hypothetical protein
MVWISQADIVASTGLSMHEPAGKNLKHGLLVFWCGLAGSGLIGLLYWCLSALRPDVEPLIVTIMYRFGDTDYLPLIYSLAHGRYSEIADAASYGTGILPFPAGTILPYALCIAAFGNAGFIVGDVLISAGRFLLFYAILRSITNKKALATGAAFAIMLALYSGGSFGGWGFRYPRPYVTQLFLLAVTLTGVHLFRQIRKNELRIFSAFGHGTVVGIATEGDMHAAIGFALATAFLFAAFLMYSGRWKLVLTTGTYVALGCLLGTIPFAFQSLNANADVLARWGAYEHGRNLILLLIFTKSLLETGVIALAPSIKNLTPWAFEDSSAKETDLTFVLLAMIGGALFAPAVAVALTGKVIQGYHFIDRFEDVVRLGLYLTFAMMLVSVRLKVWLVAAATAVLAAYGARPIFRDARDAVNKTEQQRVWGDFVAIPNYRRDLAALLGELDREKYRDARILGTFDQQLAMLWITQPRHTLFIPDTFLSLTSNEVIERRTIALSHLVGMSEEEFLRKATQPYFQLRFLTLAKWQATINYLAAPPEDYSADQLRNVLRTFPLDFWHVEMPQSVQNRLRARYVAPQAVKESPDLVILTDEPSYSNLPGPSGAFSLAYRNNSFRLFARKRENAL